jgi:hypothetical protein
MSDLREATAMTDQIEIADAAEDMEIAQAAEHEAETLLVIIQTMKPLNRHQRRRVLGAVNLLVEANRLVPGVLAAIAESMGKPRLEHENGERGR